jgi:CHAT domain-containing protein
MPSNLRRVSAAVLLLLLYSCSGRSTAPPPLTKLAVRPAESRFSILQWASPHRRTQHLDPHVLASAAKAATDTNAQWRGVGYAVLGKFTAARRELVSAAIADPNDAALHNDAAAAWLAETSATGQLSRLGDALRETRTALRLDPKNAAALFNRAIVLERLGLHGMAAKAWVDYLNVDGSSAWADEARQRLYRDTRPSDAARFAAVQRTLENAAVGADTVTVRRIVLSFPQQTRSYGETIYLGRWADALLCDDANASVRWLRVAAAIGDELVSVSGESYLQDTVNAIRSADDRARRRLAVAHSVYFSARKMFSELRIADAEPGFERAAALFQSERSPMSDVTAYYAASCAYERGRVVEARAALTRLIARCPAGHRSLRAQEMWELGLLEAASGHWTASLDAYHGAADLFAALRESNNQGQIEMLLAQNLTFLGQPEEAWRMRVEALRQLEEAGNRDRVQATISEAIDAEVSRGNRDGALALLDLQIDHSNSAEPRRIDRLIRRAEVAFAAGDQAASSDIAAARAAIAALPDETARRQLEARAAAVEAAILRRSNPAQSIEFVTHALDTYEKLNLPALQPPLRLERARAYRQLGRLTEAEADYAAAIGLTEIHRASVTTPTLRSSVFDALPDLFGEAIDLSASRSVEKTFDLAERSHGTAAADLESVREALPENTAIIEYALTRDSIVIIALTHGGVRLARAPGEVEETRLAVEHLREAIQRGAVVDALLSDLYDCLIRPAEIPASIERLVFIPAGFLQTLPFSALRDRHSGQLIVQRCEVAVAPSATFWMLSARRPVNGPQMLVIADPARPDRQNLSGAHAEAQALKNIYHAAVVLEGGAATVQRFLADAPRFPLIHFAGHGAAGSAGAQPALLFAADATGHDRIWAPDIAQLDLRHTDLVVLAGCETFLGDTAAVEAMPSMAGAFLQAGVPAVVGTLWRIEDEAAARFFKRFYRRLRSGMSPSAAIRGAQLDGLRSGNPSEWAPFEIIGTTRETDDRVRLSTRTKEVTNGDRNAPDPVRRNHLHRR